MKLYIIDCLSPFIDEKNPPRNWSRAPLYDNEDICDHSTRIIRRFESYIERIKKEGYNAISIDDMAHMVNLDIYPDSLKSKLDNYTKLYKTLFSIASEQSVKVFVNFDIMYFNSQIEEYTKKKNSKIIKLLKMSLNYLFDNYNVDGVITRMGECDGVDLDGLFKSELSIKTPLQAKRYLRKLLPLFEARNKTWIFRTWTLGSYKIGDLMWNKRTFLSVFEDIRSDNLIISMKYGNGDFFRNLSLNPLFELDQWNMIVELQTKREYDGFGELPFYTGWDYENYYRQLKDKRHIVGISVWCMTGGWKESNQITYFERSSAWVELNTMSTIKIFQGHSADQCIVEYFHNPHMIDFLRAYNYISQEIMYPELQSTKYFKNVTIPPNVWIFWDNVTVSSLVVSYLKYASKRAPNATLTDIDELYILGQECSVADIDFICDTLRVLHKCREYIEKSCSFKDLNDYIDSYQQKYPDFYNFSINQDAHQKTKLNILFRVLLRDNEKYRLVDYILFNRLVSLPIIRFYILRKKKKLPDFVDEQAMPLTTFLK